jgi:hypothetical protein
VLIAVKGKMLERLVMKDFDSKCLMALSYLLVIGAALLRLGASHPYNVIPVFSCLLFFSATRPAREFVLPLSILVGVDVFLTAHRYGYPLSIDAVVTWTWYLIVMLLGSGVLRISSARLRVASCSLLASVSFFLVSNFAVWAAWQMYPRTLSGLGMCYMAAVPFFRNSLTSELCVSLLLFGLLNHARSHAEVNAIRIAHC